MDTNTLTTQEKRRMLELLRKKEAMSGGGAPAKPFELPNAPMPEYKPPAVSTAVDTPQLRPDLPVNEMLPQITSGQSDLYVSPMNKLRSLLRGVTVGATAGATAPPEVAHPEETHPTYSGVGEFLGAALPIGLAAKGVRAIPPIAQLGRPFLKTLLTEFGTGAAYGGAVEGVKAVKGEEPDLTNIPQTGAEFALLGAGLRGLGKAGKYIGGKVAKRLKQGNRVLQAQEAVKQPWEMTRDEFEKEIQYHGTTKKRAQQIRESKTIKAQPPELSNYDFGEGVGPRGSQYFEIKGDFDWTKSINNIEEKIPVYPNLRKPFVIKNEADFQSMLKIMEYKPKIKEDIDVSGNKYETGFSYTQNKPTEAHWDKLKRAGYDGIIKQSPTIKDASGVIKPFSSADLLSENQIISFRPENAIIDPIHKNIIESALKQGKPVPPKVLADYPGLTAKKNNLFEKEPPGGRGSEKKVVLKKSTNVLKKSTKPLTSEPQSKQVTTKPVTLSGEKTAQETKPQEITANKKVDIRGDKVVPEPPVTLSFMGANPDVAKQLGENVVRGIEKAGGKITPPIFKQARNRVNLPESKKLFSEIERADELWHRRSGTAIERFKRLKLQKLSDAEAVKLADEIENPVTHNEYNKALDVLYYKARAKGLDMGYIGKSGKKYFPRVWKEDVLNQVFEDLDPLLKKLDQGDFSDQAVAQAIRGQSEYTQKMITHLIETGQAKSYTQAVKKLQKEAAKELFPESSFEKGRSLDLPADIFERNAKKVLPQYVDNITKRIAQVEVWGKKGELAQKRLKAIREADFNEGELTAKILDMWSGQFEAHHGLRGPAKKFVDAYMGFESATKIAGGTAVVPNVTQSTISTIPEVGVWNTLRGGFDLLTSKGRAQVRQSGVLRESMIDAFAGREPAGFFGKVARKTLKVSGFMGINKFNISLAAASFRRAVKGWYDLAQKDTVRGRWARKRLGDFGIKHTEKLTENLIREKSYRFGADSQLQKNVLRDPVVFNDPVWRPFFLFKRFGYRQATYIKDMLWRETIRRKNPMPLLRLAVGGALGGEFVIWAKNQIKEQLTGEPYYRKDDKDMFKRVMNDLAAVGSFGMVSDMMEIESLSGLWNKAKFLTMPVFMSDIEKTFEALTTVTKDWEKYGDAWLVTKRNSDKLIGFFGSLPRYASQRLRTEPQKKNRLEYFKGKERTAILDLMLDGKGTEASHRIELWNKHHAEKLTAEDINSKELLKRARKKARDIAEAKGEAKPASTGSRNRTRGK